ncbi:dihydropteroate synthase [Advenella sp. WQ 585]|uniref:Dihydropteroate synthase n=1 Tax=Advenella mandrilli TaxID=2800330 RepID=A0ABS1E9V4_9BURK|nr:dihydropteroate synthase [Advenella mandrilli]MBK1779630.1 dihydropteroate synthase [Advenella mandrilli]
MNSTFLCGRFELGFERPLIMGIVNITPDSFSDGSHHFSTNAAIDHALELVEQGADILDIGGESTRPGSEPVSIQEELDRVIPVIEGLRNAGVPLSIDTFKPEVMKAALLAGVDLINDIYALRQAGALEVVNEFPHCGICIMHMHGEPKTMQVSPPDYGNNITQEVAAFLQERMKIMLQSGIDPRRIMIDPGFGFGKTAQQNFQLLREMAALIELKAPILVGVSRKTMIGAVTHKPVNERLSGSIAAALAGVARGAVVVRVHDVTQMHDALAVWNAVEFGVNE